MNVKVSVIVPVYNVARYLDACVESIVNQTYRNLEIVLVDDGSTDGSGVLCDRWAAYDDRIRVIHQENQGLSAARNTGIDCATGDYLYFVDSDDYISRELCQRVMECVAEHSPDIVCFKHFRIEDSGITEVQDENPEGFLSPEEAVKGLLSGTLWDYAWDKLYKTEVFREHRYPVGKIFEDIGTTYLLFLAAKRIYCLDAQLYYYRIRKESLSGSVNQRALCSAFEMRMERHNFLKERYPEMEELDLETIAAVARCIVERSWFEPVDGEAQRRANAFLEEYRDALLRITGSRSLKWFYKSPVTYRIYRRLRRTVSGVVHRSV